MKKLLFLSLFVFGLAAVNANAQTETKAETTEAVATMATKAAAADENIIEKVCAHSGTTSYYKKGTSEKTGSTIMTKVVFDSQSNSFIPAEKSAKSCAGEKGAKKCCAGGKGSKSCAGEKGGKASKSCAGEKGKAGCCKGGKKKGCSKSNSKTK